MKISRISIVIMILIIHSCTFEGEWSPEDSSLLFSSNRDGNSEIYIKNPDDTTWINLTDNNANDNWPVWAPDGNKIAFQSSRTGKLAVWIMNRDGSGLRQLTTRADNDYLPSFTPNGSQITFLSWRTESREEKRAPHIYIMNSDGSAQRRLVDKSTNTSSRVSWHPSGQRFVYASKTDENSVEIMEADRDGNFLKQLTRDNLISSAAEYSPDGTKIAFYQDDGTKSDIIVMNADGTNKIAVISDGKNYYPHWSPDGQWITFTKQAVGSNEQNYDIYAVSIADRSEIIKIIGSSYRDTEGSWEPKKTS